MPLRLHCRGYWVQALVRELRSHMPVAQPKKKKVTCKNYIIRNVIQQDGKNKRGNQVEIKMISP